jgi:predicted nucleic acid-binding protein
MIVVDASVLTDALVDDGPMGAAARTVLITDPHWAAPAHLLVEVVSAIRGKTLGGKLGVERASDAISALPALVVDEVPISRLVDRMWELRGNLTSYDAAYIAAAEALDCPLLTSDVRLAKLRGLRCEIRVVT